MSVLIVTLLEVGRIVDLVVVTVVVGVVLCFRSNVVLIRFSSLGCITLSIYRNWNVKM